MRLLVSMLLLVALLGLPAPAHAGDGWRHVPGSGDVLATDGADWSVGVQPPNTLVARTDANPREVRTIDLGPECTEIVGGPVTGSGMAAASCNDTPGVVGTRILTADLATGAVRRVPFDYPRLGLDGFGPEAVGRRWLQVLLGTTEGSYRAFVDLETGAIEDDDGYRVRPDLDAATPTTPLCAPVRRPEHQDADEFSVYPEQGLTASDGDWLVFDTPGDANPREEFGVYHTIRPSAWHCGHRRPVRLGPACDLYQRLCPPIQGGGGVATVVRGSRITVTRLARIHRPRVVRTPVIRGRHRRATVLHTASRLWAVVPGHGTFTRWLP